MKKTLPSLLYTLILVTVFSLNINASPDPFSIEGTWQTNWGPLTINKTQTGYAGRYGGSFPGTFIARAKVRYGVIILFMKWRGDNGERGLARLVFTKDSFTGTWGKLSSYTNGGAWKGTREKGV